MKRNSLRSLLYCSLLALIAGFTQVHAQKAYLSSDAIPDAEKAAKAAIGSDAVLTFIGTVPIDTTIGGIIAIKSKFDLTTGKAGVWGYVYYSPSTDSTATIVVVNLGLGGNQAQNLGNILPFPLSTTAVDVTVPNGNSDKLVARLATDTAFTHYRSDYPSATPGFVSLGQSIIPTGVPLPDNFPTNQPLWTVSFSGAKDSTMTCFVGAQTGDVYCQRLYLPPLSDVPESGATQGTAALTVAPNPANGRTRVTINVPDGVRLTSSDEIGLYNTAGQKVLDLGTSLRANDMRFAEFDAKSLPAGVYYCRAIGSNWNGVIGVVVGK
jgi:hypothetical protein